MVTTTIRARKRHNNNSRRRRYRYRPMTRFDWNTFSYRRKIYTKFRPTYSALLEVSEKECERVKDYDRRPRSIRLRRMRRYVSVYTRKRLITHARTYAHTHARTQTHTDKHKRTHAHTHTYTYTHTHTQRVLSRSSFHIPLFDLWLLFREKPEFETEWIYKSGIFDE